MVHTYPKFCFFSEHFQTSIINKILTLKTKQNNRQKDFICKNILFEILEFTYFTNKYTSAVIKGNE